MKFGELRVKCQARTYLLEIVRANGKTERAEISLDYTVEPQRKLARWDGAEVEWFRPTITQWPVGYVSTLEVTLHANHRNDH